MSPKRAIIPVLPIMLKSMMGFLMANGQSRVENHWDLPYKQLPALKQSLAKVVHLSDLGATRYQAVSKFFTSIVLGTFCLSFLASPSLIYAQNPLPSVVSETVSTISKTAKELSPSTSPTIQSPIPSPTPTPPPPTTNFQLPHPGYITTPFSSYHPGIDICIGLGMPIKPLAKGVVTEAGYNVWGLGLMVEVDHGNGYKSLYAHMGKIYVSKGKEVSTDEFLGEVGMTGHTSGPHTHLELSYFGKKIDPRPLLPELRNYPKEEDFVTHKSSTPSAVTIPSQTVASNSANVYTGIVETAVTPSPPEDKAKEEKQVTPEKISQTILRDLIASESADQKDEKLSLNLTDKLPQTSANYAIATDLSGNNFKNILSLSMHQSKNIETKQKFEALASENLTNMLAKTNPESTVNDTISNNLEDKTLQHLPIDQATNIEAKQKFEELASEKLTNLLSETNPQPSTQPEKIIAKQEVNYPTGGEISFNFKDLFNWK